ncbi:unnamed protein product [Paramecium pentaurelia]|uniref:Ribosomal protein n=1 Tax=Paramecium pentaurelia TaxID=43138 RepID=A0A8S1XU69_9CILI|nr:unnamed protein product [Paramecium pentaurelia]
MLLRGRVLAYFAKVKITDTPKIRIGDAVKLIKESAKAKFDETIDFQLRLNVDPKHGDQNVRGTCMLPGGLGKNVSIAVLTSNEFNEVALRAGADFVGQEEILKSIKDGTYKFEKLITTQDMLIHLKPFARLLGTKGLMPNPKAGTLVLPQELSTAIKGAKAGSIEFRVDSGSNLMVPVGKKSFEDKVILMNIKAFSIALNQKRPISLKGQLIGEARIKTTMGKPVEVDVSSFDQRNKENDLKDLVY